MNRCRSRGGVSQKAKFPSEPGKTFLGEHLIFGQRGHGRSSAKGGQKTSPLIICARPGKQVSGDWRAGFCKRRKELRDLYERIYSKHHISKLCSWGQKRRRKKKNITKGIMVRGGAEENYARVGGQRTLKEKKATRGRWVGAVQSGYRGRM